MSKILVIGTGPLYSPDIKVFCGQSLRTWHITDALHKAGHAVDLVVIQTDGHEPPQELKNQVAQARHGTFNYGIIHSFDPQVVLPLLQQVADAKDYDGIVTVNVNAGAIAARLKTNLPLWADLMGHMMGEAQAKCMADGSDDLLLHFWKRQRAVLRRADRVSVSGHKQTYAVLGELGSLGRLNRHNATHSFCSYMPIAADPMFLNLDLPISEKIYRGSLFPEDAFTVLWTGGYNTWTDIKALAGALTLAMEQIPRLQFVSTGGAIPGHSESNYPEFVELMRRSGFEERCHFLGWVEGGSLPQLYAECDLGLNLDGMSYETLLGGRNRLTNMMAAGLPVLTTLGTEISEIIADNRLGYTVKIGAVQEYADTMVRSCKIANERRQVGARARAYARDNFAPELVTRPLLRWAAEPGYAPDNAVKLQEEGEAGGALNSLEEEAMLLDNGIVEEMRNLRERNAELESVVLQLQGSRFFKIRERVRKIQGKG